MLSSKQACTRHMICVHPRVLAMFDWMNLAQHVRERVASGLLIISTNTFKHWKAKMNTCKRDLNWTTNDKEGHSVRSV